MTGVYPQISAITVKKMVTVPGKAPVEFDFIWDATRREVVSAHGPGHPHVGKFYFDIAFGGPEEAQEIIEFVELKVKEFLKIHGHLFERKKS